MTKDKKEAIQKIVNNASYNPEYGCYVAKGQDPKDALRKAQQHHSYKHDGGALGFPMERK